MAAGLRNDDRGQEARVDLIGNRALPDLLAEQAERRGAVTFLVFEDKAGRLQEFTYRDFAARVERVAAAFDALGVRRGEKVTVHLPNCPEFLLAWFGLATLGAVTVPSNVANTGDEMLHVVNNSDSVAIVTEPASLPMFWQILDRCPAVRRIALARTDKPHEGVVLFDEIIRAAAVPPTFAAINPETELEMIFTSGTTARPKGVVLTHANALRSGERMVEHLSMRPGDRVLTALPAFHVNAQSTTILSSLTVGATCILLEAFSATRFWQQIRDHEATCTSLVAALLRTIAAQPPAPGDRKHRLRAVFFAINVTDQEKEAFEKRFGVELLNGYGLSEAMTVVTAVPTHGPKKWPSIGRPVVDREVRIVDETDREVSPGTVGEIVVRGVPGRTIMKGYYKDPVATAAAVRDGWLHTGDHGYMDEQGWFYFFDRKKDVIKRGGENVSASEVERVLAEHPGILEAAVIAVPDPIKDEAVKAFVVLRETLSLTVEEIVAYCATRLAKFKVPSFVEIRAALPKTSIGKVEKKVLREEPAATATLQE
ncbi:MAG: AMP-binding protein [Gemmatimonadetes bacterium]|nr:AMP-binding protein [Gemmatimonadota bacterium]